MFIVTKEVEFDAGHRVPSHNGKCRSPHGHRYRVQLQVAGGLVGTSGSSDEGMVADFGDIKSLLTEHIHDVLDHGMIVYFQDFCLIEAMNCYPEGEAWKVIAFPYVPTAENIAKWCWDQLKEPFDVKFAEYDIEMQCIRVWETPTSVATYEPDIEFPLMSTDRPWLAWGEQK